MSEKVYEAASRLKIVGGTLKTSGPPLCNTCRYSLIRRGERYVSIHCEYSGQDLPFQVFECNQYSDKSQPSLHSMEDVAWILRTDPKQKGTLGFFSPDTLKKLREAGKLEGDR